MILHLKWWASETLKYSLTVVKKLAQLLFFKEESYIVAFYLKLMIKIIFISFNQGSHFPKIP